KKARTALNGRNLFIDLVERISHEFNVTNCWICRDTRMAEIWPWEGIALNPQEILKLLKKREGGSIMDGRDDEEMWSLRSELIGEECLWRGQ
ncbi:ENR1 protein, partial [Buphagus erythrorhynchus]|nr:ENR1 protein [Buphagus erythrorhynchus]